MIKTRGEFNPGSDHLKELCGKYVRLRQDIHRAKHNSQMLTVATVSRQMTETKTDITRVVALRLVVLGVIRQADIHRLKVAYKTAYMGRPDRWEWHLEIEPRPITAANFSIIKGERV